MPVLLTKELESRLFGLVCNSSEIKHGCRVLLSSFSPLLLCFLHTVSCMLYRALVIHSMCGEKFDLNRLIPAVNAGLVFSLLT